MYGISWNRWSRGVLYLNVRRGRLGSSKRRAEQQAYEDRLDEAMKRVQAEKER